MNRPPLPKPSQPRIAFACSGGGHLRQILQLRSIAEQYPHFFITERTPLAESIERDHRVAYVEDIALGLLKRSPKAWWNLIRNLFQSSGILWSERPDLVISTGAGAALPTLLLARLFGAKVIFLETFAHTRSPSLTGRIVSRWANAHLVQWKGVLDRYPRATLVSPLVVTEDRIPAKPDRVRQIAITVGTHAPFDRLVREVEKLVQSGIIKDPVVAQVGEGGVMPTNIRSFETCPQGSLEEILVGSRIAITHAGTGSILSALKAGCRVIAFPRRAELGEHYDNHQREILEAMVGLGAILAGDDPSELSRLLTEAETFEPVSVYISPDPIEREIRRLIAAWFPNRSS